MEKQIQRTLAYNLAHEISPADLHDISGGSAQMTHRETIKVTGSHGADVDVMYDQVVDF